MSSFVVFSKVNYTSVCNSVDLISFLMAMVLLLSFTLAVYTSSSLMWNCVYELPVLLTEKGCVAKLLL